MGGSIDMNVGAFFKRSSFATFPNLHCFPFRFNLHNFIRTFYNSFSQFLVNGLFSIQNYLNANKC